MKDNLENKLQEALKKLREESFDNDIISSLGIIFAIPKEYFLLSKDVILQEIKKDFQRPDKQQKMLETLKNLNPDEINWIINNFINEIQAQLETPLMDFQKDFLKEIIAIILNIDSIGLTEEGRRIINIPIQHLDNFYKEPAYAHNTDSGMDIYSPQEFTIHPGETKIIPTGIKIAIPNGYEMQVRPRSGLSAKTKLRIANAPGTIDASFRGEIGIIIENTDPIIKDIETIYDDKTQSYLIKSILYGSDITIGKGERFAQIVLTETPRCIFYEVDNVEGIGKDRKGGFGSTGVK